MENEDPKSKAPNAWKTSEFAVQAIGMICQAAMLFAFVQNNKWAFAACVCGLLAAQALGYQAMRTSLKKTWLNKP